VGIANDGDNGLGCPVRDILLSSQLLDPESVVSFPIMVCEWPHSKMIWVHRAYLGFRKRFNWTTHCIS